MVVGWTGKNVTFQLLGRITCPLKEGELKAKAAKKYRLYTTVGHSMFTESKAESQT